IPKVAYVMSIAPPGPPPPPPPPGGNSAPRQARVVPRSSMPSFSQPAAVPTQPPTVIIDDPADAPVAVGGPGGVPGGVPNGIPGGIPSSIFDPAGRPPVMPRPPEPVRTTVAPPTKDPTPAPAKRISIVKAATPIRRVDPIYPPLARTAGISGTVELVGV